MAVTVTDVKNSFREFTNIGDTAAQAELDALLAVKLAEAQAQVDYDTFENPVNGDTCVKYLTARLVALSPAGMNMKLAEKNGQTIYDDMYYKLARAASFGFRVP